MYLLSNFCFFSFNNVFLLYYLHIYINYNLIYATAYEFKINEVYLFNLEKLTNINESDLCYILETWESAVRATHFF